MHSLSAGVLEKAAAPKTGECALIISASRQVSDRKKEFSNRDQWSSWFFFSLLHFTTGGKRMSGLASFLQSYETWANWPLPTVLCLFCPHSLSAYCKSSPVPSQACPLQSHIVNVSFDVEQIQITFRSSPTYCTAHFFAEQHWCWSWVQC